MLAFRRGNILPKRYFTTGTRPEIDPKETKKQEGWLYLLSSPYNWLPMATGMVTLGALWYYWPSMERKHHKEIVPEKKPLK